MTAGFSSGGSNGGWGRFQVVRKREMVEELYSGESVLPK
jgi:hypothetical protein